MVRDFESQLSLVTEFVNTRDLETGTDAIAGPDELAEWLSDNELTDDLVEPTDEEQADAVRVREAIRDLLLANNGAEIDTAAASATLDEVARKAQLGVRFHEGRPVLEPSGDGASAALGRLIATVAELAASDKWPRLKACRDESCRYVFFDQSRNRSRAWCSMEVCGNREKARSFRERHHAH
jgi:predicted RNA-binding Zn ribbon-like protein